MKDSSKLAAPASGRPQTSPKKKTPHPYADSSSSIERN
jgi:hypothetical protein